jgi:hypothetical protein
VCVCVCACLCVCVWRAYLIRCRRYTKKKVVTAFMTDAPVEFKKTWGVSAGVAGDWVIVSSDNDLYVCGAAIFQATYERVPGAALPAFARTGAPCMA